MAITFDNLEFPGTHDAPQTEPCELHAVRSHFSGLNGESEIILGRGGRNISIPIVVHGTGLDSAASVVALMDEWDRSIGFHGELRTDGAVDRTFVNCTFLGFTPSSSVLPDVAGTLNIQQSESPPESTYYFVRGVLTFRQISAEDA